MSDTQITVITVSIVLVIHIVLATFVYRDAKKRGLNTKLWTTLTLVVPNFFGAIMYFIIRTQSSSKKVCHQCHHTINQEDLYCPKCGAGQMDTCTRCDQPLHETWIVCPKCSKPVGEENKAKR